MRDIQKKFSSILEKIAVNVVNDEKTDITLENLIDYAG